MKNYLSHQTVSLLAQMVATQLLDHGLQHGKAYAVPRGGVPAAYAIMKYSGIQLVSRPEDADFFIDDLIDSGSTMERFCDQYPGKPFLALIDKTAGNCPSEYKHSWIVFPWEVTSKGDDESATDIVVRLLEHIGEDPERGGLKDTPRRVLKAWEHWTSGYGKDVASVLKVFQDGAENCDEMIIRVVPFYSHCEHHLAAIIGHAVVAYIPNDHIVGLSKIDRVVDIFARRLQVQERLTNQIAESLMEHLQPKGVGVWVNARHMCIESRGVSNQCSATDTLALRGVFKENQSTRAEFLAVARSKIG